MTFVRLLVAGLELVLGLRQGLGVSKPQLQLDQLRAIRIPEGVSVTGAALSDRGTILFWAGPEKLVYLVADGRKRQVCSNRKLAVIAGAFVNGDTAELLERTSGRVYRLLPTGACRLLETLGIDAYAAARTNGGWLAGIRDSAGREIIALVGTNPSQPRQKLIDSVELGRTHLTASDGGVVTSAVHWPFRWTLHRMTSRDVVGLPFVHDTLIRDGQDSVLATRLLGLPTFPLDHGYLQLLTDPASDLRVLTIYDEEGVRKRSVVINAAIGVLATRPSARQLLMLRQTNRREIVLYGWHWRNPHSIRGKR